MIKNRLSSPGNVLHPDTLSSGIIKIKNQIFKDRYYMKTNFRMCFKALAVSIWILMVSAGSGFSQVTVALPDTAGEQGTTDTLAVSVSGLVGYELLAVEFRIKFDPDVVALTGMHTPASIAEEFSISNINTDFEGELRVAAASAEPVSTGSAVLTYLVINYLEEGETGLEWDRLMFNEGEPEAEPIKGEIRVNGPKE